MESSESAACSTEVERTGEFAGNRGDLVTCGDDTSSGKVKATSEAAGTARFVATGAEDGSEG